MRTPGDLHFPGRGGKGQRKKGGLADDEEAIVYLPLGYLRAIGVGNAAL